uniref:BHLH domain-containing protein n=1 Tax=Fagus sylvatica TaxID=28930 RepID=A0A2N9H987_FAGSY
MDYIPTSLFQYDQEDELLQISSIPCQKDSNQPDQLPVTTHQHGSHLTRKLSVTHDETDENPNDNNKNKKKLTHRDIERQRRQKMATLHTFLQSLLPVEDNKGKRSISDHIHESVNYIKHLKNKIRELNNKRDELKRLSNTTKNLPGSISDTVDLRSSSAGVEVVITGRQGLPLSRVLEILMREGLSIVSFNSTKVNERLLHTIESEVP